ncbi:MAG: para-aminobenzoate synthetase component, partial [Shewanella sp.]|nr:para-aminobenzoate synthetase component [Shewanella sp.]
MHISNCSQIALCALDWDYTVPQLFSHFAGLPWAVLLDSADAAHPDAKFDLISAWPLATLTTHGDTSEICDRHGQKQLSAVEPFQLLQQLLADCFPDIKPTTLPFGGGAIGCFGYDLGRKLEKLPALA